MAIGMPRVEQQAISTPSTCPNNILDQLNGILKRVNTENLKADAKTGATSDAEMAKKEFLEQPGRNPEPILRSIGVGRRYVTCSFDSYEGKPQIVAACRSCGADPFDLVLTGDTGTGKTHLAVGVLRELVRNGHIRYADDARFVPVPELLADIRACYRPGGPDERDIMDRYSRLKYLVLDDLGAEKTSEWSISTLYLIIDRRYRDMRPTIVTTNLSMKEIPAILGQRISSRLTGGKIIEIKAGDYRTKRFGA
ncbi:MAG: ATP-binding protein [Syntrophorhabdaceae bacterium]|nr:ATP-binding protein [Syntrophorhabdaceae bacterium]